VRSLRVHSVHYLIYYRIYYIINTPVAIKFLLFCDSIFRVENFKKYFYFVPIIYSCCSSHTTYFSTKCRRSALRPCHKIRDFTEYL